MSKEKTWKWAAHYEGPGAWRLLDRKEYEAEREVNSYRGEHSKNDILGDFRRFDSLKEAKAYLRMHLRGDRNEATQGLRELKEIKS